MKTIQCLLIVAFSIFTTPGFSISYKALPWKKVGAMELSPIEVNTLPIEGVRGRFVRIEFNTQCGYFGYSLSAEGAPYNPDLVFDRNFIEYTPFTTAHYFFVREEATFQFTKLHAVVSSPPKFPCELRIAIADLKVSQCGTGKKVFAEGSAQSEVAAHIATDLAWNRTVKEAQRQCHSPQVCKVPNQSQCSWHSVSHSFHAECHGWFVCE